MGLYSFISLYLYYGMIEIIFILLIIFVILKILYDIYTPHIDIIKCFDKHTVILWYNEIHKSEVIRTYIKLFEYE